MWALVRDGMTVQELVDACEAEGLNARADLTFFVTVYKCVEVRRL